MQPGYLISGLWKPYPVDAVVVSFMREYKNKKKGGKQSNSTLSLFELLNFVHAFVYGTDLCEFALAGLTRMALKGIMISNPTRR